MIIQNEELKKITQEIKTIVDEAIKSTDEMNKAIDKFKADDIDKQKQVDILKAKRWNIIKDRALFGLQDYEVITDLRINDNGELEATVENLLESWKANYEKSQKEQDERANELLNPTPKDEKVEDTKKE